MRSRTRYPSDSHASSTDSISVRSENRTGVPVAYSVNWCRRIAGQLAGIARQYGFQVVNVSEAATVQKLAAGIDGLGKRIGEVVAGTVDAGDRFSLFKILFNASITCSPAAQDIEVL